MFEDFAPNPTLSEQEALVDTTEFDAAEYKRLYTEMVEACELGLFGEPTTKADRRNNLITGQPSVSYYEYEGKSAEDSGLYITVVPNQTENAGETYTLMPNGNIQVASYVDGGEIPRQRLQMREYPPGDEDFSNYFNIIETTVDQSAKTEYGLAS